MASRLPRASVRRGNQLPAKNPDLLSCSPHEVLTTFGDRALEPFALEPGPYIGRVVGIDLDRDLSSAGVAFPERLVVVPDVLDLDSTSGIDGRSWVARRQSKEAAERGVVGDISGRSIAGVLPAAVEEIAWRARPTFGDEFREDPKERPLNDVVQLEERQLGAVRRVMGRRERTPKILGRGRIPRKLADDAGLHGVKWPLYASAEARVRSRTLDSFNAQLQAELSIVKRMALIGLVEDVTVRHPVPAPHAVGNRCMQSSTTRSIEPKVVAERHGGVRIDQEREHGRSQDNISM